MRKAVSIFVCLIGVVAQCIAASVKDEAVRFAKMYVAPMAGTALYRLYMPDAGVVEFKIRSKDGRSFVGPPGWTARRDGDAFTIEHRQAKSPMVAYRFLKGRPDTVSVGKDKMRVVVDTEPSYSGPIPEMWNEDRSAETEERIKDIWRGSGRFRLFYRNPNRTAMLFVSFGFVFLSMLIYFSRPWIKAVGSVGFIACGVLQYMTGSRSLLAVFLLGTAVMLIHRYCGRISRRSILMAGGILLLLTAAFFAFGGGRSLVAKFSDEGNLRRVSVFQAVPRMLADAPAGWGSIRPGRAYMDWYQPIKHGYVTWTLISGHFTVMAAVGWFMRFAWVLGWATLLAVLFRFAKSGGRSTAFVVWGAFAIASAFNPLLSSWSLWIVPVATLATFAKSRPWLRWKDYLKPCACAVAFSLVAVLSLWLCGRWMANGKSPSIAVDGNRVLVNGDKPKIWVVDDEESLGWVMAAKDIRAFYAAEPKASGIGYVRSLADLPKHAKRLVLAGAKCREYVEAWKAGRAPRADELLFLSPGFAPDSVPNRLRATCRVMMAVGEFALRYRDVYGAGTPPKWVGTVTGAEVYLPGWMSLAVAN